MKSTHDFITIFVFELIFLILNTNVSKDLFIYERKKGKF